MLLNVAILMTLAQAGGEKIDTAADAIAQVHADLAKQPLELRPSLRYISLHHLAAKTRIEAALVLAGHCQHLSRASDIVRPASVAGGMLLRVNLDDYGWKTDVWERLRDPYFIEEVPGPPAYVDKVIEKVVDRESYETIVPGRPASDGRYYGPGKIRHTWKETVKETIKVPGASSSKVPALAPWLTRDDIDKVRIAEVLAWTRSQVPVVRGDWWFNQTAQAPLYYEFLGIKTVSDFEKLIGFDRKLSEGFRIELRGAAADSGVTLQPRAIARYDALGGGFWYTADFIRATGKQDPLEILGKDIELEADGFEGFGSGPNGFWFTFAADKKKNLVNEVPGNIASNHISRNNDKQIRPNISCLDCHRNGGLQDISEWSRGLLNPPLELRDPDYKRARELRQQYLRKLEPFLSKDRAVFEDAVKETTGLTSKVYLQKYADAWWDYENRKVTAEIAARDIGVTAGELQRKLEIYVKALSEPYSKLPPLSLKASSFIHKGAKSLRLPIRQYEDGVHAELQRIVRGVK